MMRPESLSAGSTPLRRRRPENPAGGAACVDRAWGAGTDVARREWTRARRLSAAAERTEPAAPADARPAAVFEANRRWIQQVAEITCRRNSVWGDDAEDFAALAAMKVVEDDFAVLRQFQG